METIITHTDFYDWLNRFINFEKRPHNKAFCLDVIRHYTALFSNPHTAYRCAHIAGSKGKGSVAAMLSVLLTEAGYRTGLYTSPHVNDFRERITDNGVFFSDEAYLATFRTIRDGIAPLLNKPDEPRPSWFELVTLTAFVLFRQQQLDWAVFETGMGGRLDATNIIQPEIVLLTPIELEHCEYLGGTLPLIAAEKAGIMKHGVPVFCARQQDEALAVFKERAQELALPFFYLPDFVSTIEHRLVPNGREVVIRFSAEHPIGALFTRPLRTTLPLFTPVQAENAALAAAAFKYRYPDTPEELIEQGLSKAWLPARFQILRSNPLIVIDGAHTRNSLQTCTDTFFGLTALNAADGREPHLDETEALHRSRAADSGCFAAHKGTHQAVKPALVFACAADKNPEDFAPLFAGKVSRMYLTLPGSFKKGDLDKTVRAFTRVFAADASVVIEADEDFDAVLHRAFQQSIAAGQPLLITGSFYLAAEAQRIYSGGDFQGLETTD